MTYALMDKWDEVDGLLKTRDETKGVHHELWEIPLKDHMKSKSDTDILRLSIWDYAGQHVYRGTHQCFFSSQALHLLAFDLTVDPVDSSNLVCEWARSILASVSRPVFCLVGTKLDIVLNTLSIDDVRVRYETVLQSLHTLKDKMQKAFEKQKESSNWWRSSESIEAQMILPPLPSNDDDVDCNDCWLIACSGSTREATIATFRTALVRHIESSYCRKYLPHLHEKRVKTWFNINSCIDVKRKELVKWRKPPIYINYDDFLQENQGNFSAADLEMALTFYHDCGLRLW
jgi:GTPase SAR1 family protein